MVSNTADPYTLTLFTAQSGALSARLDHTDGTSLHLHSLVAPEREADYYSNLRCWGDRIVLLGCALGYHLLHLLESAPETTSFLMVEYYRELANRSLASFPSALHSRVAVLTNKDDTWKTIISSFLVGGRYIQTIKHPSSNKAHPQFYQNVAEELARKHPIPKTASSVALMEGNFFVEQEMHAAAEKNGSRVTPFNYRKYTNLYEYEYHLQKMLQYSAPSFFLSVNMLGYDASGVLADYTRKAGIPLAVWFVDDPHPILLNQRGSITTNMIAFTWEKAYIPWLRSQGFGEVHYLPLATDPALFSTEPPVESAVDYGFIGSSMGEEYLGRIAEKFLWQPHYRTIAGKVAQYLLDNPTADIFEEIIKVEPGLKDIGDQNLTWLRSYCIHTASMLKRQKTVSRLIPTGVQTFGDPRGWKQLCGETLITHPDFDYRQSIARYYREIKININITSCQMPTAVNQRVFDAPASGSFLINDTQKDLDELFTPDEYITYATVEELMQKSAYYLDHESERLKIVTAARDKVLRKHTYPLRFIELSELITK
jgi:spore maturation protein CgeB